MEQKTRGGRGFWYIWGSVLIKLGIAYLVYMAAVSLLAGVHLMQMTGGDADAMMQIAQSTAQSGKLYDQITNELMNWAVYIEGVAALITIPVMLFLFHRDSRKEKELGIITERAPIWKYIAIIVMFAVMALGLNNLIFLSNLSAASESYSDTMQTLYGQGFSVQILVLGILMPTCEELVYRGLVYKRLRYTSPFWAAAMYSSLVFAFTHGNLVQGLYGFIMGLMFCYVWFCEGTGTCTYYSEYPVSGWNAVPMVRLVVQRSDACRNFNSVMCIYCIKYLCYDSEIEHGYN